MKLREYALYKMIFETCGEEPEMLENIHISEISPSVYHLQYKEKDPYEGVDLKVKVKLLRKKDRKGIYFDYAEYTVFDSVYGDDGTFNLSLVSRVQM